jgi:hypothetical protein
MVGPLKDLYHRIMKQSRGELPEYYSKQISSDVRQRILLHYASQDVSISTDIWRDNCQKQLYPNLATTSVFENFLTSCSDEEFLSALQILLMVHLEKANTLGYYHISLNSTIEMINKIFRIEKIGYELSYDPTSKTDVPFLIIPIDSEYLHNEVIQPTRALLYNYKFDGVLNEFDNALDDLRHERYEDCIHKIGKSYESTLKTILDKKGIAHSKGDKIPTLVIKVRDALKLTDPSLNTLFEQLWTVLNQGPNVIRNFEGIGHGQGANIKKYEESYANFVLHLAGTYIVFLLERYDECV